MANIVIPIITTVLGAVLTYYFTCRSQKRKLDEVEIKKNQAAEKLECQRRLMFYREMRLHLHASHDLFIDQCKIRNRLLRSLGYDPKTFDWEKLEETLSGAYPTLNGEQRNQFGFIRAITENSLFKRNEEMLTLLKKNPDYFHELAEFQFLQSHLELWKSKFESHLKPREDYCLIYVGVKEKKPFPTGIEAKVDQVIENMNGAA
jgi:hypothetical protein